ncbi:MAG: hypothetical protein ACXVKJ_10815, partial [Ilumatobacteraceae bacterium]
MDLRASAYSRRRLGAAITLLALMASTVIVEAATGLGTTLAAAAGNPTTSAACTANWTGASGDGSWATGGNWSSSQVPTATDVACIGSTAGPVVLNSGLAKVFTVGSVFVDPGSSLTIGGSI